MRGSVCLLSDSMDAFISPIWSHYHGVPQSSREKNSTINSRLYCQMSRPKPDEKVTICKISVHWVSSVWFFPFHSSLSGTTVVFILKYSELIKSFDFSNRVELPPWPANVISFWFVEEHLQWKSSFWLPYGVSLVRNTIHKKTQSMPWLNIYTSVMLCISLRNTGSDSEAFMNYQRICKDIFLWFGGVGEEFFFGTGFWF